MSSSSEYARRSRNAWGVLTIALILEAIGGAAVVFMAFPAAFADSTEPFAQRISILLAAVLAFVWVVVTLGGALRLRAGWVRGSALTIHVLLFAAGTGILQTQVADPLIGWILIVLAFAGFIAAIISRPADAMSDADRSADK